MGIYEEFKTDFIKIFETELNKYLEKYEERYFEETETTQYNDFKEDDGSRRLYKVNLSEDEMFENCYNTLYDKLYNLDKEELQETIENLLY